MKASFVSIAKITLLAAIGFLLPGCAPDTSSAADEQKPTQARPNIIVILFDDMGFSDLGAYGGEIRTPAIDALAEKGERFSSFYVTPRCSPTRAALLTGLTPHEAGMAQLAEPEGEEGAPGPYQGYLTRLHPTLPQLLREQGYSTYMSGKWHVGEAPENWPLSYGFDEWAGLVSGASSYWELIEVGDRGQKRKRQMAINDEPWTPEPGSFYMTDAFSDWALSFVMDHGKQQGDQPFFLYLPYTAPHWPLHAYPEDIAAYDGVYDAGWDEIRQARLDKLKQIGLVSPDHPLPPRPDGIPAWSEADSARQQAWIENMQTYAAMIERADAGIARLLNELQRQGELENTLILILSDNGGDPNDPTHRGLGDPSAPVGSPESYRGYGPDGAFVSNTPWHGYKKQTYEGGVRSPFIVHWPNGPVPAGDIETETAFTVSDLMPALLSVASSDRRQENSFVALDYDDAPVFIEHEGFASVRTGRWKAVLERNAGWAEWKLFDLSTDPVESRDMAEDYPDRLQSMKDAWKEWAEDNGVVDDRF